MRRFFSGLLLLIVCGSVSTTVFAQTNYLQTSPNLRLNNYEVISPDKLKAVEETVKPNDKKDREEQKPLTLPRIPWETIAVIISICSGIAAITGFSLSSHKKKKAISKYMEEIDKTFSEYKWKSKRCEAELYRLRDLLEERLKKGRIDESLYELLTKRIDKYLHEIQNLPEGA